MEKDARRSSPVVSINVKEIAIMETVSLAKRNIWLCVIVAKMRT